MARISEGHAGQPHQQVPAELVRGAGVQLKCIAVMPWDAKQLLQLLCHASQQKHHKGGTVEPRVAGWAELKVCKAKK